MQSLQYLNCLLKSSAFLSFLFSENKQSDASPLEYQTHFSSIHLKSSYALDIPLNLCLSKTDSFVSVLLGLLKLLQ